MISEWRSSQPEPGLGFGRRSSGEAVERLPQGERRRARMSARAALVAADRAARPATREDMRWVGDSMQRTTEELAVYVFRGEATVAHDLVVSHRGPGRDRLLGGKATGATRTDWAYAVHPTTGPCIAPPSRTRSSARARRCRCRSGSSASTA